MGDELKALVTDPAVDGEAVLYRRAVWSQIGGRDKVAAGEVAPISKNFFSDRSASVAQEYGLAGPCMSIGLASKLDEMGLDVSAMLRSELLGGFDASEFGVLAFKAADLRQLQRGDKEPRPQGIMLAPMPNEPWHGVVFDLTDQERATATRRAMAKIAYWAIPLIA